MEKSKKIIVFLFTWLVLIVLSCSNLPRELSQTSPDAPWLSCLIGILPRIKTKVAFLLSYLDAQNLWIKERYNSDIDAFNKAWSLNLKEFENLKQMTFKEYPSKTADTDFYSFSEVMVKRYIDQPYYGRFDGENFNIGVVTLNNLPYPELTNAMEITNKRIYDVASGVSKPFTAEITRIPSIHY